MKFKNIIFFSIMLILLSCSSNNNSDDTIVPEDINFRLTSVQFPSSQAISAVKGIPTKRIDFNYDESNNISQITVNGAVYGVNIVNSNLIELDLLEDDVSLLDIKRKRSIHLQNNLVEYIKVESEIFSSLTNTVNFYTDSISYTYVNDYISKIESFSKNASGYELIRKLEYQIVDGNVSRIINSLVGIKTISDFSYDNSPKIHLSEFAFHTPLYPENYIEYILIHDKIGKQNTNNVTSVFNTYEGNSLLFSQFESIEYTPILNSSKNLTNIEMSGKVINEDPDIDPTDYPKYFSNLRVGFVYEKY